MVVWFPARNAHQYENTAWNLYYADTNELVLSKHFKCDASQNAKDSENAEGIFEVIVMCFISR